MATVLAYAPDGSKARVMFSARAGTYNDSGLITFIRQLRRQFTGDKVTLIWNGLTSHRSRKMQTFLDSQRSWLTIGRLTGLRA